MFPKVVRRRCGGMILTENSVSYLPILDWFDGQGTPSSVTEPFGASNG